MANFLCFSWFLIVAQSAQPAMDHLRPTETVTAAALTPADKREIFTQLDQTSFDTPDTWDKEVLVRRVRLGDSDGLVIQGSKLLCGSTGNCATWVFRRTRDGWHNLFNGDAPLASVFAFDVALTNGVPNLVIETRLSADVTRRTSFTFNGAVYQPRVCAEVSSSGRITIMPCRS